MNGNIETSTNVPRNLMSTRSAHVDIALVRGFSFLVSAVFFLLLAHRVFVYTPDDSFITYRYSHNLADGFGPVFNQNAPATDRTEGYSCFLFMAIMALLIKLVPGLHTVFLAKFLGLLCGIGVLVLAPRLALRLGLPDWAQLLLPVLLAMHTTFAVTGVNGMETMPMMFLMTLAVTLFLQEWGRPTEKADTPGGIGSALAFAACALMRPEGILSGLLAAGLLLSLRHGRLGKAGVRWLLAFAIPVIAFFCWRYSYYGLWLPNTYYAKNPPLEEALEKGAKYLMRTFFLIVSDRWFSLGLAGFWWLLVLAGAISERLQKSPRLIVVLMTAGQIVFVLKAGGDGMGGWRFMATVVPLVMALSLIGISDAVNGMVRVVKSHSTTAGTALGVLLIMPVLTACGIGHMDYWEKPFFGYLSWASKGFTFDQKKLLEGWLMETPLPISEWLNANIKPGSLVAYTEMGATPYFCRQIRFLDANGLTDHGVATLPGVSRISHGVVDDYISMDDKVGPYLLNERKPDYILRGVSVMAGRPFPTDSILNGGYLFLTSFPLPKRPTGFLNGVNADPNKPEASNSIAYDSYMRVWKRREG